MFFLFVTRLSLVALIFLFSAVPFLRGILFRFRRFLLPFLNVIIFAVLFYIAREQFIFWQASEFTKVFIPPLNPSGLGYFLEFIYYHLIGEFIFSLVGAYLFLMCALWVNKRYNERFFYEEELYFGAAGVFLIGYPGLIYYLFLFLGVYILFQIFSLAYFREAKRITPYYLWLPLAALLIIFGYIFLDKLPYLSSLVL